MHHQADALEADLAALREKSVARERALRNEARSATQQASQQAAAAAEARVAAAAAADALRQELVAARGEARAGLLELRRQLAATAATAARAASDAPQSARLLQQSGGGVSQRQQQPQQHSPPAAAAGQRPASARAASVGHQQPSKPPWATCWRAEWPAPPPASRCCCCASAAPPESAAKTAEAGTTPLVTTQLQQQWQTAADLRARDELAELMLRAGRDSAAAVSGHLQQQDQQQQQQQQQEGQEEVQQRQQEAQQHDPGGADGGALLRVARYALRLEARAAALLAELGAERDRGRALRVAAIGAQQRACAASPRVPQRPCVAVTASGCFVAATIAPPPLRPQSAVVGGRAGGVSGGTSSGMDWPWQRRSGTASSSAVRRPGKAAG